MHILIGSALALGLLYFWLVGWWIARVVVFLLLAAVGFAAGAGLASTTTNPPQAAIVVCGMIGAALTWPLTSIPIYYRRHRESREFARRGLPPQPCRAGYMNSTCRVSADSVGGIRD